MAKNKVENQGMIRRVYQRIILLGMLVHVLYIALGGWLTMTEMVFYNVGSTVFYLTMLVLVFYGRYRLAVALIHLEVCVFVVVGTHALGWETGLPLLLIAMASLIYICPYRPSTVPFLFSLLEIGVFAFLKLTSDQEIWLPQALPGSLVNGIYRLTLPCVLRLFLCLPRSSTYHRRWRRAGCGARTKSCRKRPSWIV